MKRIVREVSDKVETNPFKAEYEQITFEQALDEVEQKPLAWIEDGKVYWVWCTEEGLQDRENDFFSILCHKDGFNHFWFYDFIHHEDYPVGHKTIENHILDKPCFQSESWEIFNEIDLPQLIRMAREGG